MVAAASAELFARRVSTHHGEFAASYLLGVEEDDLAALPRADGRQP